MLYIAYFITVSGHNIKKMFCKRDREIERNRENFHFGRVEGRKLHRRFVHTPKAIEPPTNGNSIAFGNSTSHRIYSKQRTHQIGRKRHKYGLKHALHSLDGHFK